MVDEVLTDMGRYAIAKSPLILLSLGLGSCVGIAVYDRNMNLAGLAHIMLPTSAECTRESIEGFNLDKFADVAIPKMIKELESMGCRKERMKAKIAGGAHMFSTLSSSDMLDIGKRNIESVKAILKENSIPLISEETGGNVGRTIRFYIDTEKLQIKTKDGTKEI